MIRNTNDGSTRPPRMRLDINGSNVFGLPASSSVPKGDSRTVLEAVKAAGFEGIQTGSKAALAREVGLRVTGSGRINIPEDAEARAIEAKSAGYDCYTVHVGWGIEDDDQACRLVEATLRASEKHEIPIYIETHRATITDDIWRTVQLVKKFPEIRFNGDFSHWYAGHEMVYGDIEAKWQFMQPVFERVRFIHARIANPGCIQVDIGDGTNRPYVEHFKQMWTRSFAGFLGSASPGDLICFTPELLGPDVYYARTFPNAGGDFVEESDRWQQALVLARIGRECWDAAQGLA
jgi:sugar phosphate isomerase/epimerase